MARTSPGKVQKLLGRDYNPIDEPDLDPYIDTANSVVTRLAAKAAAAVPVIAFTDTDQELVERWLGAHYYTKSARVHSSASMKGRSASFVFDPDTPEPYKKGAIDVDPTGLLAALLDPKAKASFHWLGKPASEQIAYEDRN